MNPLTPSKALPREAGSARAAGFGVIGIVALGALIHVGLPDESDSGPSPRAGLAPPCESVMPTTATAPRGQDAGEGKPAARIRATFTQTDKDLALLASVPWSQGALAATCRLGSGDASTLRALVDALRTANTPDSARWLAMALARQGTGDAVEAIWRTALDTRDPMIREAILTALDALTNEEGTTLLASALAATNDAAIVEAATRTMARAATADTVAFLAELYLEQPAIAEQREQILQAVQMIVNRPAVPALGVVARRSDQPELAAAAAASLAKIGDGSALRALRDAHDALAGTDLSSVTLRGTLRGAFAAVQVTDENSPAIVEFASDATAAEWQAIAQALASQRTL